MAQRPPSFAPLLPAMLLVTGLGVAARGEEAEIDPAAFDPTEPCSELDDLELLRQEEVADAVLIDATPPAEPALVDPDDAAIPEEWAPSQGRQCHRYRGRVVCEGPRRVPLPQGEAAERAERLGLGTRAAAGTLLRGPAPEEWVEAVRQWEGEGAEKAPLFWPPVDGGTLWRHFGVVRNHRGRRRLHKGIDLGGDYGAVIRAVHRGLVVYSDNGIQGYGNTMLILHSDHTVALYAHCQANYVFAGQFVKRGQAIGEVGTTGLAHGAHLHLELRRKGYPVNPYPLFEGKAEEVREQLRRQKRLAAKRGKGPAAKRGKGPAKRR